MTVINPGVPTEAQVAAALPASLVSSVGVGDDATDNGPLLQAQYNAGKNVLLGPGTFVVQSPVFDTNASQSSPWVIDGEGRGTVLKLGEGLPTVSGFFSTGTFNPGDVTATWAFFANTKESALVTPSTAAAWAATTGFGAGKIVTDGAGHLFSATTGGLSGGGTPSWKTAAGETTADGTVVWTCMGAASAVDVGQALTLRNTAAGALSRKPRIILRNLVLDGGGLNAGFLFGAGASVSIQNCILQNWKFGYSWTGYTDSSEFVNIQGQLPNRLVGPSENSWLCYGITNGDGLKFDDIKMNGRCGHFIGYQSAGVTSHACIGGGFWFRGCQAVEIAGWHAQMNAGANLQLTPALLLNQSVVSLKGCWWQAGNEAGNNFCKVNDESSTSAQASHLTLDGCSPTYRFLTNTDYTRIAGIYIQEASPSFMLVQRNSQAVSYSVSGANAYPDCEFFDSAVPGIATALANPTYPAAKSALSLLAQDFILHQRNGEWKVDAYESLAGVRSYAAQETPTALAVTTAGTLLPTISSITNSGTEWTVTFATAHGLSAAAVIALAGFTPAGYNGTFTVASVVSSTVLTITNATSPGAIEVAGTSCTKSNVVGTLEVGKSYDYTVAVLDDDGKLTKYAADVAYTAVVSQGNQITLTTTAPGGTLVVFRAQGAAGTAVKEPSAYCIIPLKGIKILLLDTGANLNGHAWIKTSVPVPESAFAATTSTTTRMVAPLALSAESVTSESIKKEAVTATQLGPEAVTAAKLAKEAVTAEKIKAGAVTGEKLGAASVETAKIKEEAVTESKLAKAVSEKLLAKARGTIAQVTEVPTTAPALDSYGFTEAQAKQIITSINLIKAALHEMGVTA